jgi:general secretion pathway protein N
MRIRMRLPLGRTLLFLALFAMAMMAMLPLRLVLDWIGIDRHGFAAREVRGSVWFGSMSDAQLGAASVGDVQARLRTLPLLVGRARVDLLRGGTDALSGGVTVTSGSFGIDDMNARLSLGDALAPLPVGAVDLRDLTARFSDGACSEADGLVRAAVAGEVAGVALPGGLSGNARCDGRMLLLPLASQSGMESLFIRLSGDGRYRTDLLLRINDPAIAPRMAALGFTSTPRGYRLRIEGGLSGAAN